MNNESLAIRAKRWSAAIKDSASGPLIIAPEIVDVVDHWADYKSQADGVSSTQWLRSVFGKHHCMGPGYWRKRARAVQLLGEASRRTTHHEVAVWVTNKLSGADLAKAHKELNKGCRTNGGLPLNMAAARNIISDLFGWRPRVQKCKRCLFLEQLLAKHGIDVPVEYE